MRIRSAFTLIELMIVLSIVALLSGMLMSMVSLGQQRARKTNTLSLLRKVETGLELFRGEMDTYPYQHHDGADPFPAADNRLAWTLGRDLTPAERTALNADLQAARGAYATGGSHAVVAAEVDPKWSNVVSNQEIGAGIVNRMAGERAALAILAGNVGVRGIRNRPAQQVIPNPMSKGFGRDYLAFDLDRKNIVGDAIIDLYGNPLVYVCPVVQGMRPFHATVGGSAVEPEYYGAHTTGRARATTLISDIRTTAAPAYMRSFELWSAGPSGRFDPMRDGPDNRDNIAAQDYWRALR